ncbi:MAG: acylphosphatase [Sphingomonas bacterium]|jgi:acylphosphatase|nr:acylphosphatase [Sphingomonas bacterium]
MGMMQRLLVSGRVHRVGYRDWTVRNARALGLTGWVRNLSDGRVEILADGDEDSLHKLLEALRTGPRLAEVEHVEALSAAEEKAVKGFTKRLTVEA